MRVTPLPLVCVAAILAAACTGNTTRLLPTAPTAAGSSALIEGLTANSTSGTDEVIDRSSPDGQQVRDPRVVQQFAAEYFGFDAEGDLSVEGTGPITSATGSCPNVTMTIYGVAVTVSPTTSYPIGSGCSGLGAGRVVRVRGVLFLSGGTTTVLATSVTIEGGVNTPVEGEGVVTSVAGVCPAGAVTLRGVTVTLGAGTVIRWRSGAVAECADLLVGMYVQVHAEVTPEGAIIVSRITIQSGGAEPTSVSGTVSAKSGSCPNLTFVVDRTPVTTSSSTLFVDGTCSQVLNGARVEATGPRNGEGGIGARQIKILQSAPTTNPNPTPTPTEPITVSGEVSDKQGTCPSVYVMVGGAKVKTTSSTTYTNGACSDVLNGARVEATGTRDNNGWLVATRLKVLETAPTPPTPPSPAPELTTVTGLVSVREGTCPTVYFKVGTTQVRTSSSTVYSEGACAHVLNGARVEATGTRTSGWLIATRVKILERLEQR